MPNDIPHDPATKVEASPTPKDLRAELMADLKSEFTANLAAAGTLSKAACESLVALLGDCSPVSANVIAALRREDHIQPEVAHE